MILRRLFVGFTALVTVIPAVVLAAAEPAAACSCAMRTELEQFADAKAVFTGTVTEVLVTNTPNGGRGANGQGGKRGKDGKGGKRGKQVVWTFAVDRVYKGKVVANEEVVTAFDSAACGLGAKPGKKPMLVFAGRVRPEGKYTTSLCAGDRLLSDGPIPPEFGSGTAPRRGKR